MKLLLSQAVCARYAKHYQEKLEKEINEDRLKHGKSPLCEVKNEEVKKKEKIESNTDQEVGLKLAFIGSIKDEVLQTEELAAELIHFLRTAYPEVLADKYDIEMDEDDKCKLKPDFLIFEFRPQYSRSIQKLYLFI